MEKQLIYEKISNIMKNVWVVGKWKKNTMQGYMFRWIDDMYNALNEHLANEKVFFTSEVLNIDREERQAKNWWVLIYSILTMKFTAFAGDGSNVSSITVWEAMDSWDKSMNKAMSVAYKYALMQIFCIPTEEEKDTEFNSPEVVAKTNKEEKKWYNWLNKHKSFLIEKIKKWETTPEKIIKWLEEKWFSISSKTKEEIMKLGA